MAKSKALTPFTFRIPSELVEEFDRWVAAQNKGRKVKLTRSDVIRGVLQWAARNTPNWEERTARVVVEDAQGKVLREEEIATTGRSDFGAFGELCGVQDERGHTVLLFRK